MLLRRFSTLQDELAAAMAAGKSVGGCVQIIERHLEGNAGDLVSPDEVNASSMFISSSSGGSSTENSQQEG